MIVGHVIFKVIALWSGRLRPSYKKLQLVKKLHTRRAMMRDAAADFIGLFDAK